MLKKRYLQLTCFCLSLVLLIASVVQADSLAYREDTIDKSLEQKTEDAETIRLQENNYLSDEEIDLFKHDKLLNDRAVQRIDTPEDDLRIAKYLLDDNTVEMRIFNDPLKYICEDGKVHTKSMKLYETLNSGDYRYSNRENDIQMRFGEDYSKGVIAEYQNHSISILPFNNSKSTAVLDETNALIRYESVFSENTHVYYQAQYSGLKEDIVLDQFDGICDFSFKIISKDQIKVKDRIIQLLDENDVCIGTFGEILLTDASGKYTYGESNIKKIGEDEFVYTISAPIDFLTEQDTQYPVTIDPSFTFNFYSYHFAGYKQIYDVTLSQSGNLYQPNSPDLQVYFHPVLGYQVSIVKFPNLRSTLLRIGASNINYVGYSCFSFTNSSNYVTIMPMCVNWNQTAESLSSDIYSGLYNGYYPTGHLNETIHLSRNDLNITDIAQGWLSKTYSNYGIMIRGVFNTNLASAEAPNGNYRPYISVNYNYQNNSYDSDPMVGLKRLIPYDTNGFLSSYSISNTNNVVMTQITESIYDSNQLLLITGTPLGYTIQNPYNNNYLTSDYDSVFFSSTLTSSSYWSFVDGGLGFYIVGTNQEQLDCLLPSTLGANVIACLSYQGTYYKQPTTWFVSRQLDKIPFKIKNVYSGKYLTVENAYDKDNQNLFQRSLYSSLDINDYIDSTNENLVNYHPSFGSQKIRVYYDSINACYELCPIASENGRLRTVSWDNSNNAIQYKPSSNKLSINFTLNGQAIIRQKTGSRLALTAVGTEEGIEGDYGKDLNHLGNVIFTTYDSSNLRQKWILEFDLEHFQAEAYYSQIGVSYPLPSTPGTPDTSRKINSDYGARALTGNSLPHDGIDLYAHLGTTVYSTIYGEVVEVRKAIDPNAHDARGLYVLIQSNSVNKFGTNDKICMFVQHLSYVSENINVGTQVTPGTIIGQVGWSGLGGPESSHLHYGYCLKSDFDNSNSGSSSSKYYRCYFVDPLMLHGNTALYSIIESEPNYLHQIE